MIISEEEIKPDLNKVNQTKLDEKPKNLRELQKLLGFLKWFRPFLFNLSSGLFEITKKLRKNENFVCSHKDTEVIARIKSEIQKQQLIALPKYDVPFETHIDASDYGVGSVLTQKNSICGIYSEKFSAC